MLYDEQGNEVEDTFSQEEMDQKVEETKTQAIADTETKHQEALDILTDQKSEAEEKAKEAQDKFDELDPEKKGNFKELRDAKKGADKKVEDLTQKIEDLTTKTADDIASIKEGSINDVKTDQINDLAGDNTELKEKIEHFYKSFGGSPATKAEVLERVKNAHTLATGGGGGEGKLPSSVISSAGGSSITPKTANAGKLSDAGADIGKKLGLSDKELKENKLI